MKINEYLVQEYNIPNTLAFYRTQFHEMVLMDKAHGMMLVKQGLLSAEDYCVVADGLDKVDANMTEADVKGELGDLYFNLTEQLYGYVGQAKADLIHVGRSRNDMNCACNRMQVRRELWTVMQMMNEVMETMANIARDNLETVITFYTFGQPAQPGTLAHYLMLAFDLMARSYQRLMADYRNTNRSPMGAAAGIGTGFPLDRQYVSDLLGFDSVIAHSIDAISSPDFILEVEADMAILMSTLSKMAQDLYFWCSYEYKLLDCNDSISGGSSIMPQKKNPHRFRADAGLLRPRYRPAERFAGHDPQHHLVPQYGIHRGGVLHLWHRHGRDLQGHRTAQSRPGKRDSGQKEGLRIHRK